MTTWLWVDDAPREAAEQMALDAALLAWVGARDETILRLYAWREDTLSLGAHEAACRTWDRTRLAEDGVAVVRRPTGGRGVWHAATDLTYAWAGPLSSATARQTYREIHARLAGSLRALGLPAVVAEDHGRAADLAPGACFELAIGGEVLVGARKVIGSAQRIAGSAGLQHGAIARADHAERTATYRLEPPGPRPRHDEAPWPEAPEIAGRIAADWASAGGRFAPPELTRALRAASVQDAERFRDPAWTWRR